MGNAGTGARLLLGILAGHAMTAFEHLAFGAAQRRVVRG